MSSSLSDRQHADSDDEYTEHSILLTFYSSFASLLILFHLVSKVVWYLKMCHVIVSLHHEPFIGHTYEYPKSTLDLILSEFSKFARHFLRAST